MPDQSQETQAKEKSKLMQKQHKQPLLNDYTEAPCISKKPEEYNGNDNFK